MTHPIQKVVLLLVLLFPLPAAAAKTDVVYLHNGDRITGEVKDMSRGKLKLSTDHMGTVYIEWEDILNIVSDIGQAVELVNGERFYGPLAKPEDGERVAIRTEQGTVGVNTIDVVSMYPVEAGFWQRLNISARLGFSWDKGSNVGRYSLGMDAEYRDLRHVTRADFNMEVTTQDERDDTSRANLGIDHLRFRRKKQYTIYYGSLEKNDELGIDLRGLIGAGYGWAPIRSNTNWFSLAGGLAVNREIPTEGEGENNLEAVGQLNYDYYRYSFPERKFSVNLAVYPSLTDFGRLRADFKTDFRLEFVKDLFWVLDFYASFDSDPISEQASNSDYGVTSSLAYKF